MLGRGKPDGRLALFLCFILILWAAVFTVLAQQETAEQRAIQYIEEAKEIHEAWIVQLRNCEDCDVEKSGEFIVALEKSVGTVEYHQQWIEKYKLVLEVLKDE